MPKSYEQHLQEAKDAPQLSPIIEPVVRLLLPTIKGQGLAEDPRNPWRGLPAFEEWYSEKQESARHMRGD